MYDHLSWASSMWGWLPMPPDPAIVGDPWKEMWRERIRNADFWFKPWASNQPRDDYWGENSVRDHYDNVQVPVFVMSGWQDGYKNPVERVVSGSARSASRCRACSDRGATNILSTAIPVRASRGCNTSSRIGGTNG